MIMLSGRQGRRLFHPASALMVSGPFIAANLLPFFLKNELHHFFQIVFTDI
jgi:hypothetical protein